MEGVPRTLDIEVAALTPGMFEARVIIESEGGEDSRFTVRGHVLDGVLLKRLRAHEAAAHGA